MKKRILKKIIYIMAAFVLSLFAVFESTLSIYAKAEETTTETESIYTDVLEDLSKDSRFSVDNYPVNNDVYKLEVIQIAESSSRELFVYVYQSYTENAYIFTEIRIATPKVNTEYTVKDYSLTLLSKDGVLYKYRVDGLAVSADAVRYYDIVNLSKPYKEDLENGNVIETVSYAINQSWTAISLNGTVEYRMTELETIRITDKYVGFVRYDDSLNGLMGNFSSIDSHFVAFSTDKPIDKILEADISYSIQNVVETYGLFGKEYYDYSTSQRITQTITSEDKYSKTEELLWWKTEYEFYRISTVEQFLKDENREIIYRQGLIDVPEQYKMTDEGIEALKGKQWVFRFYESEYFKRLTNDYQLNRTEWSIVSEITVLRLKFDMSGETYNLAVVDNKISEGENQEPVGGESDVKIDTSDLEALFGDIMTALGVVLGLAVLAVVIAIVLPLITPLLRGLIKGLWWIICFPFNIIGKLFRKK